MKEPRVFLSSLDRFLISGLVFSISACKVLNKALVYSTCFAWIDTVFSTRILDDSSEHFIQSEFLYSNLVIYCVT